MGHGARSAVAFVFLLRQAGVTRLVDVRAHPVSRRHPQFSREALEQALAQAGIRYDWQGRGLGGMRKGGYAAHMETALFMAAAAALVETSRKESVCIMCAETDPADCHRSHISDWLVAQGERVLHLIQPGEQREHAARLF
ncbi:MAG TPA: DUF488 domain-containing protein [Burkholderiales bacterium]|nr:DUF488 domain-containing protein [Burkholderiales bacterium]